jgi:hypothetical protein
VKTFSLENFFGDGKHFCIGTSVNHPSKPASDVEGWFCVRAYTLIGGYKVEANPDGPGVMMSEIRHIDLAGSMPGFIMSAVEMSVLPMNFDGWNSKYREVNAKA